MARSNQDLSNLETCDRCRAVLRGTEERCSSCGAPTRHMSFQSRAEYEVEQWRRYKAQTAAPQASAPQASAGS
jgi:predicted amidophosphoribosyltransferase